MDVMLKENSGLFQPAVFDLEKVWDSGERLLIIGELASARFNIPLSHIFPRTPLPVQTMTGDAGIMLCGLV